jgi:LCP family protein required for cell wall assembly
MRRAALTLTLILIISGCTPEGQESTTSAETVSTTTSTIPTTTTTIATTTTTLLAVNGEGGADPQLAALVRSLYTLNQTKGTVPAPQRVVDGFVNASAPTMPPSAAATVGVIGDTAKVAVITAGHDVTLAVADPTWRIVGGWWPSHQVAQALGNLPKTIAVVGSDARPRQDREETRADSIHFLVLAGDGSSALVGLPRDSWVPIDGGGRNKVNSALYFGGLDGMMRTFTDLTGAEFDGYLLTGFRGFRDMINVLGGLEIDVPRALNDRAAQAALEAGLQVLDSGDALAFTRVRKALSDGDFGRQLNGGLALMAAAEMVQGMGPDAIPDLLEKSWGTYSTDLSPEELLLLAGTVLRTDLDKTTNVVAPGSAGSAGAASVVYLRDSAYDLFEDMQDGHLEG